MGHPASPPADPPGELHLVGRVIADRYWIEALLERTLRGSIYRARRVDGRSVLLRVLAARGPSSRELCRSALALAERAAMMSSPHVARTLDVGMLAERWLVVVSEHSRGCTLSAWLPRHGPPSVGRALLIGRQLASALEMAHLCGLAHGPLHLDGVWVEAPCGRPEWVRLLDFGLSELPDAELELNASGVFLSPALPIRRAPPSRAAVLADLRGLGSILEHLVGVGGARLAPEASAERAVRRALARLIDRCTGVPGAPPPPSMTELRLDLDSLAERARSLGVTAEPGAPVTVTHAPPRRAAVRLGGPKVIVRDGG